MDKQIIDLSGPQGNAYFLMGIAKELSKKAGLDFDKILTEMKSSNYENLLNVFESYFSNYVDLVNRS